MHQFAVQRLLKGVRVTLTGSLGYVPPIEFGATLKTRLDALQQPLPGELSLH